MHTIYDMVGNIICLHNFYENFRICVLMAEQSILLRDNHQAIIHYREALKYSPDDIKTVTALARLHLQVNDVTECQNMCTKILKYDPNNEAASVMMADLSFRGVSEQYLQINAIRYINKYMYYIQLDEF